MLAELFSSENRNREKVENNAVRCLRETTCVEEKTAQSNRSTPVRQWAMERRKSCSENDLRTSTTDGRRQPGRRGARNNPAGGLRGIRPCGRNRWQENGLRRPVRIRETSIVASRRANREKKANRTPPEDFVGAVKDASKKWPPYGRCRNCAALVPAYAYADVRQGRSRFNSAPSTS